MSKHTSTSEQCRLTNIDEEVLELLRKLEQQISDLEYTYMHLYVRMKEGGRVGTCVM